ncbi:DNA glycosylase AlkZ-like family protein, partial [Curtobacterium sp. ISL-83]|uniref:DNA glycosylase AlkZ-like family protein n=1 Tax=Curtobacterium sp. ISL-83 TaxID=2819145 RepID=UPI001BEC5061|nr:winged helix DNA-binding domain-containing protein [Curtobacterium sp. ISL-83]
VRGRVVGTWTRTERTRGVQVTVRPFVPLDAGGTRALEAAADRVATFLRSPVSFTVA